MNLLDLLARELESWPDSVETIAQDASGIVGASDASQFRDEDRDGWTTLGLWQMSCKLNGFEMELSSDHSTAIITRDMWQSARDKLKGENAMPKGNKDGWIRHLGGKCPVAEGVRVDYRMRNDKLGINERAELLDWGRDKECPRSDIMAYRIHAPEQAEPTPDLRFLVDDTETAEPVQVEYADSQMPAAKYFDGPLQWRDRIHAIDFDKASAQQAHDSAMAAMDSERAELVAKLKAEGLALISEPIKAEDSAQGDMGDWRNWRVGDLVEVIKETEHSEVKKGTVMPIESIDEDDRDQHIWIGAYCPHISALKWHSRPSKP